MRRTLAVWLLIAVAFIVAGCGGSHPSPQQKLAAFQHLHAQQVQQADQACPQAANGHGQMGACVPPQVKAQLKHQSLALGNFPTYPDLSNNDPLYDLGPVARAGHPLAIFKANQGGFIDRFLVSQSQSARAHGMCVGGYDFAQDYTAQEAWIFIGRLHAAGIWPWSHCTAPPTIDVEFGAFSIRGLLSMVHVLFGQYHRVNIYTGCWYWDPHAGGFWPSGVTAWLSGYPNAFRCQAIPAWLYTQHQYSDNGFNGASNSDMNVYLGSRGAFLSFVHNTPAPKPKPKCSAACKRARLAVLVNQRAVARRELLSHGCRKVVKHQTADCRRRLAAGDQINIKIRALGGR